MEKRLQKVYIENFKAYNKNDINLRGKNTIFIGENDSGKSSILEALDYFFNKDQLSSEYVRDLSKDVVIGVVVDNKYYKKVFSLKSSNYKFDDKKSDSFKELDKISYIYIPIDSNSIDKVISDLSLARIKGKISDELIEELCFIGQTSINEVIDTVDEDLMLVNNDIDTKLSGTISLKTEGAFKIQINSSGIPLVSRGSGFKKNLMLSLLTQKNYENTILGIDEIENSFSIESVKNLLSKIIKLFSQCLITTHSKTVIETRDIFEVYPILTENLDSLKELLLLLDKTDLKKYLLVEGKYDVSWITKALEHLGKLNEYIVIPSGGANNINHLNDQLTKAGKICHLIFDGDQNEETSLSKNIIEQYTPVNVINSMFGVNLEVIPEDKDDFFNSLVTDKLKKPSIKSQLSIWAEENLSKDNPLVNEIKIILEKQP